MNGAHSSNAPAPENNEEKIRELQALVSALESQAIEARGKLKKLQEEELEKLKELSPKPSELRPIASAIKKTTSELTGIEKTLEEKKKELRKVDGSFDREVEESLMRFCAIMSNFGGSVGGLGNLATQLKEFTVPKDIADAVVKKLGENLPKKYKSTKTDGNNEKDDGTK